MSTYATLTLMMVGALLLFRIVSRPAVLARTRQALGHRITYLIAWTLVALNWVAAGILALGYERFTATGVSVWFIGGATFVFITYVAKYLWVVDELDRMQTTEKFRTTLDASIDSFRKRTRTNTRNRLRLG